MVGILHHYHYMWQCQRQLIFQVLQRESTLSPFVILPYFNIIHKCITLSTLIPIPSIKSNFALASISLFYCVHFVPGSTQQIAYFSSYWIKVYCTNARVLCSKIKIKMKFIFGTLSLHLFGFHFNITTSSILCPQIIYRGLIDFFPLFLSQPICTYMCVFVWLTYRQGTHCHTFSGTQKQKCNEP